jgi:hypothetical protein
MKHKRRVETFFDQQYNARSYSLGTELINDEGEISSEILELYRFRRKIKKLKRSFSPDDRAAVSQMNSVFYRNDSDFITQLQQIDPIFKKPIVPESRNIIKWMTKSSNQDLANFCAINLARTHQLQMALIRDKQNIIDDVMTRTHMLTDVGLFPAYAPNVMEQAAERYELLAMDSFMSGGTNSVGFCTNQSIALVNMYKDPQRFIGTTFEQQRVMFHEYIHAAGTDRGFFRGIKTPVRVMRPIEEGFVEHATMVAMTPGVQQPQLIYPEVRPLDGMKHGGAYYPERTLLATIVACANIPLDQLGEAYFMPQNSERGDFIRNDIEQKMARFFLSPERFFNFMEKYETSAKSDRDDLIYNKVGELLSPRSIPSSSTLKLGERVLFLL